MSRLPPGVEALAKMDFDLAITCFSEAIRLDPQHAEAYDSRGLTYFLKGERDRAITDLAEAIRLNPQFAGAYKNRGLVHHDLGRVW